MIAISGPVDASVTIKTDSDDRGENMEIFTDRALQLLVQTLRNRNGVRVNIQ